MGNIISWLNESSYISPLSPACEMCAKGSKLVVLITGLCSASCFYCPLSLKKLGTDRIFADEWELKDEKDTEKLIQEAEYIKASGAGITGGDPLLVWERTKRYITLFKDRFGNNFHIHLYTSGVKNEEHIGDLVSAGLDEIRFHPLPKHWDNMKVSPVVNGVKNALDAGVDVAVEIPVIPRMENQIFSLIKWADEVGIKWINLNELEFSETNAEKLKTNGFTVKDDISAAVKSSQETALNVMRQVAEKEDLSIGVHYCSSSFKDGIQLRNRIARRAKNIACDYDVISEEGTLIKGVIFSQKMPLLSVYKILNQNFEVEDRYLFLNKKKKRIETGVWILEKIAIALRKRGLDCYMIEEYPTADQLEVERIPLPL
jgi:pyruvate formate-lyase activating enzyme-like uncharacterized protein